MTETEPAERPGRSGLLPPLLLVIAGSLLAITLIFSRLASDEGAAMLWFLSLVMGGAGLLLYAVLHLTGKATGNFRSLLRYSLIAGCFQALPMAMAYLSVGHVGAGYIALAYAFPLLITYLLALLFRMERFRFLRTAGVAVAVVGGLMLAYSKYAGFAAGSEALAWVVVASVIPVIVAGGNLFRTRFWPKGAAPLHLAAMMLMMASLVSLPFALVFEGAAGLSDLVSSRTLVIFTLTNIGLFALQFVAYFRLQLIAGPVYMSQIGSVSAAIGTPLAVILLGEVLPPVFPVAVLLIVAGAILFQIRLSGRRTVTVSS
ncbi:MAG: DMT family transporter [Rhodospirillales bacterium]